jgi:ATP-dependent Clp protease ATP-binding subunit ClpB
LPDKAIDLIDEAAARLKMEIDSMPAPIDKLERRIVSLQIEQQALSKEKDEASQERLEEVAVEIADLREQSAALKVRWLAGAQCHRQAAQPRCRDRQEQDRDGSGAAPRRLEPCRRAALRQAARA